MPIYEYRCEACGHLHDALQKISDDPLKECPECAESALKRLISAPSFRLKGGGWYETDFKSEKERKRNLADGSGDTDKKSAGEPSKETAKDSGKADKSKDSGSADKSSASDSKVAKPSGTSGKGSEAA
jgi:putative FmdB family regulatory protein